MRQRRPRLRPIARRSPDQGWTGAIPRPTSGYRTAGAKLTSKPTPAVSFRNSSCTAGSSGTPVTTTRKVSHPVRSTRVPSNPVSSARCASSLAST